MVYRVWARERTPLNSHRSLSFSLLRSAIQCIRGARSSIGHYVSAPPPMDLVRVESNLTIDSNDTMQEVNLL